MKRWWVARIEFGQFGARENFEKWIWFRESESEYWKDIQNNAFNNLMGIPLLIEYRLVNGFPFKFQVETFFVFLKIETFFVFLKIEHILCVWSKTNLLCWTLWLCSKWNLLVSYLLCSIWKWWRVFWMKMWVCLKCLYVVCMLRFWDHKMMNFDLIK